ncbi:MAG: response regulator [Nitrospinota bacterium]|nr:MAG: response regulator [Nitrospinota bacterium]
MVRHRRSKGGYMARVEPTILVVDDARVNRTLVKKLLQGYGYRFVEAENGVQALEQVREHRIDLIILDLMMPVMDGFEVLARLKADPFLSPIPVIVYSSLENIESIQQALVMGSYDYFIKSLPEREAKILLPLKVKNAIQAKLLLDEVSEKKALLERELEAASKYQRFLLPKDVQTVGMLVETFFHPYSKVGGDFFDFIPLTGEKTACIIADVSGHGVLSAMVATILKPLFSQYIRETESPRSTLERLNEAFLQLTTEGDYITAFVAVYDPIRQLLCYANAGHPPPLYFCRQEQTITPLSATGTFLGIFDTPELGLEEEVIQVASADRLLLVTDGVIEATSTTGIPLGVEGLQELFAGVIGVDLGQARDRLWQHLQRFTRHRFSDDVSFITIEFQAMNRSRVVQIANDPALVLPLVDEILSALEDRCQAEAREAIRISLVEMIMNAIEHGNLDIGYARKSLAMEAGTFDDLLAERRQREPYASRKVTVTYSIDTEKAVFIIRDEGKGFDWQDIPDPRDADHRLMAHGRGILIARSCMDECTYNSQGNEVRIVKYFSQKRQAKREGESNASHQ